MQLNILLINVEVLTKNIMSCSRLNIDNIEYIVDRGKRKNIYIHIKDGKVTIKCPRYINNQEILYVINKKKNWILNKIDEYKQKGKRNKEYISGESFYLFGKEYVLDVRTVDLNNSECAKIEDDNLVVYISSNRYADLKSIVEKLIYELYFNIANEYFKEIVFNISKITNLYPNSIRIKKLKSSWGLCSSNKNITLNVELIKYSKDAIYYVILHEICHLKYMNHSKQFWSLVECYMTEYKNAKKELKVHNI